MDFKSIDKTILVISLIQEVCEMIEPDNPGLSFLRKFDWGEIASEKEVIDFGYYPVFSVAYENLHNPDEISSLLRFGMVSRSEGCMEFNIEFPLELMIDKLHYWLTEHFPDLNVPEAIHECFDKITDNEDHFNLYLGQHRLYTNIYDVGSEDPTISIDKIFMLAYVRTHGIGIEAPDLNLSSGKTVSLYVDKLENIPNVSNPGDLFSVLVGVDERSMNILREHNYYMDIPVMYLVDLDSEELTEEERELFTGELLGRSMYFRGSQISYAEVLATCVLSAYADSLKSVPSPNLDYLLREATKYDFTPTAYKHELVPVLIEEDTIAPCNCKTQKSEVQGFGLQPTPQPQPQPQPIPRPHRTVDEQCHLRQEKVESIKGTSKQKSRQRFW